MGCDILTSCTDSGSDVKRALEKVFVTYHEWCISHLTHLALVDAFGCHLDKTKSKNIEARSVIECWRKVVETINKSTSLKAMLDAKVQEDLGCSLKMKNSPAHRWSAIDDVLECILHLWTQVQHAFNKDNHEFSIKQDRQVILEFHSIIYQVQKIQWLAQSMSTFIVIDVYINLMNLLFTVLDDMAPLEIFDPASSAGDLEPGIIDVQCKHRWH